MNIRPKAAVAAVWVVAAAAILSGCGPKNTAAPGPSTSGAAPVAATSTSPSAAAVPAVKDLTPGNCTMYTKDQAVALIGAVNDTNPLLGINTGGGTKIDTCSYLDLNGTSVNGTSYAVVRFDSAATAFAAAQQVQADMLGSAALHDWPVQTLTTPVAGAGQVLGGYGTKDEQGVTVTIAVVGTNVGPYLVAALGGSNTSPDSAKNYALQVFGALAAEVG
jgi:hypothetical protein